VEDLIVSIDIGTSKVCVIVGRIDKTNYIDIIGKEIVGTSGVKKGIIVDIDHTAEAIKACLNAIECAQGIIINSAFVNILGMHVDIINNASSINIDSPDHEITRDDVDRLLYQVGKISIPEDRQVIDIIPRYFSIDGYDDIADPIGMVGVNLKVHADILVGRITSVKNIVKSVEKAGIKIDGIIAEAYATGGLLLTDDEKESGSVLIDIGGGVTDISVFKNNRLLFYDSIPVGGDHITNDISVGLRISYKEAEKIKRKYELALTSLINNDQEITVNDVGQDSEKNVMVSEVVEIIEARVYEILSLCADSISKSDILNQIGSGVVLTGGGISYIDGNKQLASEIFGLPARIASYRISEGLKPEFYTAAGIIKYVSGAVKDIGKELNQVDIIKQKSVGKGVSFIDKILNFFNRLF
jgi:cell division protein FtsA